MISQQRALVRMPDVVGMPLKKAKLLIENAGLTIDGVVYQESYEERDTVLSQKPARGQMIYSGEKVLLGVSRESYIKWLPSMYQRPDINGRNFIRDLLWIVQHMFGSIDETLDQVHGFFDPLVVFGHGAILGKPRFGCEWGGKTDLEREPNRNVPGQSKSRQS